MSNKELREHEVEFVYRVLGETFPLLISRGLTGENLMTATKSIVAALSESIIPLRSGNTR